MSAKPKPRSPSRLESTAPSSSRVDSGTVANRQCSAISVLPSAKTPKWVWVLPTSTTSSMGALHQCRAGAADLLAWPECLQPTGQALAAGQGQLGIELEQGHEYEPARADLGGGQGQQGRLVDPGP